MRRLLRRVGLQVDEHSYEYLRRAGVDLRDVPGLSALMDQFVQENMALIADLPRQTLLQAADVQGRTYGEVRDLLLERWDVGQSRALLIATDQILKLNSKVTAHRAQAAGITKFRWNSSGDERVRPEHKALNGQVFELANPPAEGLPGQPVRCRCIMEMLLE